MPANLLPKGEGGLAHGTCAGSGRTARGPVLASGDFAPARDGRRGDRGAAAPRRPATGSGNQIPVRNVADTPPRGAVSTFADIVMWLSPLGDIRGSLDVAVRRRPARDVAARRRPSEDVTIRRHPPWRSSTDDVEGRRHRTSRAPRRQRFAPAASAYADLPQPGRSSDRDRLGQAFAARGTGTGCAAPRSRPMKSTMPAAARQMKPDEKKAAA